MLRDFQDYPPLIGADGFGELARFQGEHLVFELYRQRAPLKVLQVAPLVGRRTGGIFLGELLEAGALSKLTMDFIGFDLGLGNQLVSWGRGRSGLTGCRLGRSWRLGGNQDFPQAHLFRALHFVLVLVVEGLNLLLGYADMAADFLLDDLLGEDVFFEVLFEFFERNALGLRGFFQILHGVGVHLLAQLIKSLDDVGISADAKLIRLLGKQPGVDQIAQQVFFLRLILRRYVRIHLSLFALELLFTAMQFGERNDAVIDARDDLLDHRGVRGLAVGRRGCASGWDRS